MVNNYDNSNIPTKKSAETMRNLSKKASINNLVYDEIEHAANMGKKA